MPKPLKYSLFIGLVGAVFFIPFLGGVHLFDWDEINFAEISREMVLLKEYLRVYVDFKPFWEKPPLFFWLQSSAMQIFGANEFAARFPNAICGILTLIVLFNIGRKLYDTRFGLLWALVYFGSVLPFLYFKSGIIDPWFNLFIFSGLYVFILGYWKKEKAENIALKYSHWFYFFAAGLLIGLGILTKGPVAYLVAGLTMGVYWIFKKFRLYVSPLHFLVFTLAASLATLTWYGLETLKNGPWFITEFNKYQYRLFSTPDAGHKGFPGYHFVVLFFGVFPASVFAIRSFFKMPAENAFYKNDFRLWMAIMFWVVLILFSIVKSKIIHYSSLCYFPMTFLAALVIYKMIQKEIKFGAWMRSGILFIGGVYALATLALPLIGKNIEWLTPLLKKDPFALANLEAGPGWNFWDSMPGFFMILLLAASFFFFKKGFFEKGIYRLFGGTAIFVMLTLIFDINNIEAYSQRAAIEFFKERQGEKAYVVTHGYKSYAHLFYTQKPPVDNENYYDKSWLYEGNIDRPVYVVTKINKAKDFENHPNFKEVGRKNGFVFFKREPKSE